VLISFRIREIAYWLYNICCSKNLNARTH